MDTSRPSDPAERSAFLRFFFRDWRPTLLGRWVNGFWCWWSGLGLPPRFQAALEVRGRSSGRMRANPVAIATVEGKRYLVSMLHSLGPSKVEDSVKFHAAVIPASIKPSSVRFHASPGRSQRTPGGDLLREF
jgi:hypothetical protein